MFFSLLTAYSFADTPFNMVAFGDFGETEQEFQIRVRDSIQELGLKEPLWRGFFLGDNFYPNGVTSVDDPQFTDKIVEVYQDLKLPFFAALGNHDHLGDVKPQIKFSNYFKNPYVRDADKLWQMYGSIYSYRWDHPDLEIFVLDTEMADPMSPGSLRHQHKIRNSTLEDRAKIPTKTWEEQIAWLENRLKNSRSRWKFVIGHHPIVSDVKRSSNEFNHIRNSNYQKLKNLLVKYAHLYLSGHDHSLQIHEIELEQGACGPLQIISGAGGAVDLRTKFHSNKALYKADPGSYGYMHIRLSDQAIEIIPMIVHPNYSEQRMSVMRKFDDFSLGRVVQKENEPTDYSWFPDV